MVLEALSKTHPPCIFQVVILSIPKSDDKLCDINGPAITVDEGSISPMNVCGHKFWNSPF